MSKFTCSYPYRGGRYVFEIDAENHADAESRLKNLQWAKVDGELMLKIRLPRWFARLWWPTGDER